MTEQPEDREPAASNDATPAAPSPDPASPSPSPNPSSNPEPSGAGPDESAAEHLGADDGDEIPVVEIAPVSRPPATTARGSDWTRTEPVRDDPGTLGEEARRLWDSVREQFVDPLVRNYPEAAGHLTTAGTEFAAALRALLRGAEQRWTNGGEQRPDDGRDRPRDR